MEKSVDIIIPTFNNPEFLNPCVMSILRTGILNDLARLIIINNGKQDIEGDLGVHPNILVIQAPENLGWEGGLAEGLKHSTSRFVCFQNDDTFIPTNQSKFYQHLLIPFINPRVAAVGPTTTVAAGLQSVFNPATPRIQQEASYLIFFTVMVRREHLDSIGGIDLALPGGDDFDMSIRFRKEGFNLVINPSAFLIHHGFKTGTRVRGDHTSNGGWNSPEMTDRTNHALINKHGFATFLDAIRGLSYPTTPWPDLEGDLVRSFLTGERDVLEMGCGAKKTVDRSVGVDLVAKGEPIPHLPGDTSVADIVADVTKPLPFAQETADAVIARHILEHCIDPVQTLKEWRRILRNNGKLILAVPDETVTRGIPLNYEHVHAFTLDSLRSLTEVCGFKEVAAMNTGNGISLVGCYRREN